MCSWWSETSLRTLETWAVCWWIRYEICCDAASSAEIEIAIYGERGGLCRWIWNQRICQRWHPFLKLSRKNRILTGSDMESEYELNAPGPVTKKEKLTSEILYAVNSVHISFLIPSLYDCTRLLIIHYDEFS